MKLHANAALSLNQRRRLATRVNEEGWSTAKVAGIQEVSPPTARKWSRRQAAEGELGLLEAICALRRLRFTGAEIAEPLEMPETTVSGILTRVGLGRLGRLGLEPPRRYEKQRPGELLHVDVKKLGRIAGGAGHRIAGRPRSNPSRTDGSGHRRRRVGWEFVHVCVADAARLAYAEVLKDERASTAVGFLRWAVAFYRRHGVLVEAVMTDNGSAYVSTVHAIACKAMGLKHLRTRPRRPQTNGKAERFIRTMLGGWAYGAIYRDSAERKRALAGWLWRYDFRRPHGSLGRGHRRLA